MPTRVRETVPDSAIAVADEIVLVELTPEAPRERGSTSVLIGVPAAAPGLRRLSEPLHDRLLELLPGVDLRSIADRTDGTRW